MVLSLVVGYRSSVLVEQRRSMLVVAYSQTELMGFAIVMHWVSTRKGRLVDYACAAQIWLSNH